MLTGKHDHGSRKSNERYFPLIHIKMDGRSIGAHRLMCSEPGCGFEGDILDQRSTPLPSNMIQRKFEQKGWDVGHNEKHDRCPKCVEAKIIARRAKNRKTNVVNLIQPEGAIPMAQQAEVPREMDNDDRRIIFSKLNEVYLDKVKGYAAPWTDAAVAKALDCPAAWVHDTREKFFGPTRDNSEIREVLDRAGKICTEATNTLKEAEKLRLESGELILRANGLNTTAKELQRGVDTILAAIARIERTVS